MPYAEPAQIPTKELSGIEALPYPTTVDKLYRIELDLTNTKCNPLVDTGLVASFISAKLFAELTPKKVEYATSKKNNRIPQFKSAAGTPIEPEGYYSDPLKINKNILSRHTFYSL